MKIPRKWPIDTPAPSATDRILWTIKAVRAVLAADNRTGEDQADREVRQVREVQAAEVIRI